jgi:transaldolase
MTSVKNLKVELFADGADLNAMKEVYKAGYVKGFTTNPTLMHKAGISDYKKFAHEVISAIPNMPISFEVFSDEFSEMRKQAKEISTWGKNVNVKIPICNTKGESSIDLVRELSKEGVSLNITAIFTLDQVREVAKVLNPKIYSIVSVFAGRIADSGRDPEDIMKVCADILSSNENAKLLWASSRELFNIFQADRCGCDIITVTPDILKKLSSVGKSLEDFTIDTVKMFYNDAKAAGFNIKA